MNYRSIEALSSSFSTQSEKDTHPSSSIRFYLHRTKLEMGGFLILSKYGVDVAH